MKFHVLVLFVLLLCLFVVGSSVLLKYHLIKYPLPQYLGLSNILKYAGISACSFFAWSALICSLSGGAVWIYIVDNAKLSVAYSVTSISYITMLLASYFFFGEPITLTKIIGIALICVGVAVLGF